MIIAEPTSCDSHTVSPKQACYLFIHLVEMLYLYLRREKFARFVQYMRDMMDQWMLCTEISPEKLIIYLAVLSRFGIM